MVSIILLFFCLSCLIITAILYYYEFADNLVMIFGQKVFRLVRIVKRSTGDIKLKYESEVVELADWILDVKSLSWTDPDNYEIALITTHNVMVLYRVSNKVPKCIYHRSEVSCILYPKLTNKDCVN